MHYPIIDRLCNNKPGRFKIANGGTVYSMYIAMMRYICIQGTTEISSLDLMIRFH
jgi:hypothetical protein